MIRSARVVLVASLSAALLASSCTDNERIDATAIPATSATRTVVPAITRGVTNTPPVATPSSRSVVISDAFPALPDVPRPVVMAEVPGQGVFLVASQDGIVYVVADEPQANALHQALDWRKQTSRAGNEEGLLGLALSPDFRANGHVFLYYSAAGGARRSVISRFATSLSGTQLRILPESELIILEVAQPYANHNGGNILFGPDGMMYIGLGDGGSGGDPKGNAQDPSTLLGSILRIDVSASTPGEPYRIPADNPFVGDRRARPETFAYGFRNPWRFSFDRETEDLWAGDVGQGSREEVDLVRAGGNYGWNVMEGFSCYERSSCDRTGLTLPVVDYSQDGGNCSVIGGYVARSRTAGSLAGWYIYGDYCSGRLWALDAHLAGSGPEPILLRDRGPQLASFAEDLDGEIYLLTFNGRIYRIGG